MWCSGYLRIRPLSAYLHSLPPTGVRPQNPHESSKESPSRLSHLTISFPLRCAVKAASNWDSATNCQVHARQLQILITTPPPFYTTPQLRPLTRSLYIANDSGRLLVIDSRVSYVLITCELVEFSLFPHFSEGVISRDPELGASDPSERRFTPSSFISPHPLSQCPLHQHLSLCIFSHTNSTSSFPSPILVIIWHNFSHQPAQ